MDSVLEIYVLVLKIIIKKCVVLMVSVSNGCNCERHCQIIDKNAELLLNTKR